MSQGIPCQLAPQPANIRVSSGVSSMHIEFGRVIKVRFKGPGDWTTPTDRQSSENRDSTIYHQNVRNTVIECTITVGGGHKFAHRAMWTTDFELATQRREQMSRILSPVGSWDDPKIESIGSTPVVPVRRRGPNFAKVMPGRYQSSPSHRTDSNTGNHARISRESGSSFRLAEQISDIFLRRCKKVRFERQQPSHLSPSSLGCTWFLRCRVFAFRRNG